MMGRKRSCDAPGPYRRALQPGEKLLTSRRSSQAPSSSPHFVLRQRRSGAGPGSRFDRWQRRHPACGSPEESDPPFPGCPSWRRTELSVFLVKPGMDLFLLSFSLQSLLPSPLQRVLSGYSGLTRRFSPSLTVRSPQRGLVHSSTEHRRGGGKG